MTADIATQKKNAGPSTLLHNFTLAFAALTLCFALIAMILGNRLATLQTNYLQAEKETATLEKETLNQELETALKTATITLEKTQQALGEEKTAAEHLRRQLSAAIKDHEGAKTDLEISKQTIAKLKAMLATSLAPSATTPPVTEETLGDSPQSPPASKPPAQ